MNQAATRISANEKFPPIVHDYLLQKGKLSHIIY